MPACSQETHIPSVQNRLGKEFGSNNFDLVRIIAASQVVFFNHYAIHFNIECLQDTFMRAFSGVPLFFFVSGFLISASYERNSNLLEYAQNRFLRIFPALWMCLIVSILLVVLAGYPIFQNIKLFFVWLGTQLVFPVYNPDFLRGYGVGALNGSLWTIPVELQFYVMIPILYVLFKLRNKGCFAWKPILLSLVFYGAALLIQSFVFDGGDWNSFFYKLYSVSFVPHIFIFLIGVFFQQNFAFFYKWLSGRFFVCLILHLGLFYGAGLLDMQSSLLSGPLRLPLCLTAALCIFSFAYSFKGLSQKLLRRNDISYGVYIYHMPVANFILYKFGNGHSSLWMFFVSVICTYVLAIVSWNLIERPCLALKRHPLNPINRLVAKRTKC